MDDRRIDDRQRADRQTDIISPKDSKVSDKGDEHRQKPGELKAEVTKATEFRNCAANSASCQPGRGRGFTRLFRAARKGGRSWNCSAETPSESCFWLRREGSGPRRACEQHSLAHGLKHPSVEI